jgi:hypothetical protein
MGEQMTQPQPDVIKQTETFISKYATLAHDYYLLPLTLWTLATHTWPTFDCFPYLVITAYVKRAGKTRLMELLTMLASNGKAFSPDSPASMFRSLKEDNPCIFIDEAEKLNQETHPAREFLNKGYKRGQTISRFIGGEVVDFECYCPKAFVLIGDVYDTLRDRCIMVTMRRRSPIESANENKFRRAMVEPEAAILRDSMHQLIVDNQAAIESAYAELPSLSFLNDRDEELWTPIFSLARVLCPNRMDELTKAAVDIATEKTGARRNFHELLGVEEQKADDAEAQILLLRDMLKLSQGAKWITSANLIESLKKIPTSPWRMFRGTGLTHQDAALLLDGLNIHPKPIRVKPGKHTKGAIARGYMRTDLVAAAKLAGLQ